MDIQQFLSLGIVSALNSELLEYVTAKFGVKGSILATMVTSLIVGTIFVRFSDTGWFATFISVLTMSSTYYAMFVKNRKEGFWKEDIVK